MAQYRNTTELSKSLQKFYQEKQYDSFVKGLLDAKGSLDKGVFHYNLGTAYLKMGQTAAARHHLEKAIAKGFWERGVYKNLAETVNRLEVRGAEGGGYFLDSFLKQILAPPQDITLTFSLLLAATALALFRFKRIKKALLISLVALALIPFSLSSFARKNYQRAILLEETFSYEGPSKSFEASSEIPAGLSVIVKKREGDWLYIAVPTHFSGWVNRNKLGVL